MLGQEVFVQGGVVVIVMAADICAGGEAQAFVGGALFGHVGMAMKAIVHGLRQAHLRGCFWAVFDVAGDALVRSDGTQAVRIPGIGKLGHGVGVFGGSEGTAMAV